MHGGTPVGVLGQDDRQLNHLRRLHLGSGSPKQNIASIFRIGVRCCGKFDNARWSQSGKHIEREIGSRFVRLVHDNKGTVKGHEVDEGKLDLAVLTTFQPCHVFGYMGKVRFKVFRMRICFSSVGITRA